MEAISGEQTVSRYLAGSPRLAFGLFTVSLSLVMIWAWLVRDHRYLQAESGLGYWLGICGASLMLLLLVYPLRKRLRVLQGWMDLASWFRLHMILGVLGPLCILLHCNFQLGSTNSSVALIAMLLVAGSGLIGRYFYGKFHYGLYGGQVELGQLKADLDSFYRDLDKDALDAAQVQDVEELYRGCIEIIDSQRQGVRLRRLLSQRRWLVKMKRRFIAVARTGGKRDDPGSLAREVLQERYRALAGLLDKLAGVRLFERLFGLWHVLHIPVFMLMVVTVIVHIFVVHWY